MGNAEAEDVEGPLPLDRWDLAIAAVVAVGLWAFALGPHDVGLHDPAIYLAMARDPLGQIQLAPFCFRIGAPFVAASLPVREDLAYVLLAWIGCTGAILVVRRTATAIAGSARGLAAAGLTFTSSAVLLCIRTPYASEPLSLLVAAATLEYGRRRRWEMAGLVLVGGALVREGTLLVLLPLAIWCLRTEPDARARVRSLVLLVGPGVATYLLLHKTPMLYGQLVPERVQRPADIWRWNRLTPGGFDRYLVSVVLGSFGVLWLLLPRTVRHLRERSPLGFASTNVLILLPLFATTPFVSDWTRVLCFGIVGVAPAVAATASRRLLVPLVTTQLVIGVLLVDDRTWIALGVSVVAVAAWWMDRWRRQRADQLAGSFDQLATTPARVRTP